MSNIVISIKPEYVDKILLGEKIFEYRKRVGKRDVSKIIIYCTYPRKEIVAEAVVTSVISTTPDELWEKTGSHGGISKLAFDAYFKGRKIAYAYALGDIKIYKETKSLSSFGLKAAPQSFAYVRG